MERSGIMAKLGAVMFVMTILSATGVELPAKAFSNLGSQQFQVRENAQSELLAWGRGMPEPAMAELLRQTKIADDPEVRNRCLEVLRDLVMDEYGKEGKGYIGISMEDMVANLPEEPKPRNVIRVTNVLPKTPADQAGIRVNDLIVELNGKSWGDNDTFRQFQEKIQGLKPNSNVELKILRDGALLDLKFKLGRLPEFGDIRFFNGRNFDPAAAERAAKEAYFRRWLSERRSQK
jgi:predicted metalloprotease with PDZ domain